MPGHEETIKQRVRELTLLEPLTIVLAGRTALQLAEEMRPVMRHKLDALGPEYSVEMSIDAHKDTMTFQCVRKL
jgi:hypothetical protein